ncbi:MipA/OmpV family protein [Neptunomonas phycophila]|uniref:MipA/OmpV family protein n=1 Tax=Neptunomonas phycophila TaxID=1572645 RepID=UPI0015B7FD02|nr:MipA/OmpV family protein [Neptunomonas phycophila]
MAFSGALYANTIQDIPSADSTVVKKPDNWKFSIGAAVFNIPEYEGAEDSEIIGLPYLDVSYKDRLKFNIFSGLDYNLVNTKSFVAGVGLGIDFGRKEDNADLLEGLGDIDTTIEPKIYAAYRLGRLTSKLTLSTDAGGDGHDGTTLDFDLNYFMTLSQSSFFIPSISVTYGNDNFMQSYFGITTEQAASSAGNLPEFEAEAGIKSASANLVFVKYLSKKWTFIGVAQFKSIMGDAKDSPLVQEDSQSLIGGIVSYNF